MPDRKKMPADLIDPGQCNHPHYALVYNGPQRGVDSRIVFHVVTCQRCGTSLSIRDAAK